MSKRMLPYEGEPYELCIAALEQGAIAEAKIQMSRIQMMAMQKIARDQVRVVKILMKVLEKGMREGDFDFSRVRFDKLIDPLRRCMCQKVNETLLRYKQGATTVPWGTSVQINSNPTESPPPSPSPPSPPDKPSAALTVSELWTRLREAAEGDADAYRRVLPEMLAQIRESIAQSPREVQMQFPQRFELRPLKREPQKRELMMLPTADTPVPASLQELQALLTTNEGRLLKLFCEHLNAEVTWQQMIHTVWLQEEVHDDKKTQIRILVSSLNSKLRLGNFTLGIILPMKDGYKLLTEFPVALDKLDAIHSPEQFEALHYLICHDRQVVPHAEIHQAIFIDAAKDVNDRRSVGKIMQKLRHAGFFIVSTGKEENGYLISVETNIPADFLLTYDEYILLNLMLHDADHPVERQAINEALTGARTYLQKRTSLTPNSLHLTIKRLQRLPSDFGTLDVRYAEKGESPGRSPIAQCSLQLKNTLLRPEPFPAVLSRSGIASSVV